MNRELQDYPQKETSLQLQSKPQRQAGTRHLPIILLLGGIVLLGGGLVLAWHLLAAPPAPASTNSTVSVQAKQQPAGCTSARIPIDTVLQAAADGLHLSVTQVKTQIVAGKTIAQVAAAQGITPQQLHTIELNALQTANNRWLSMGCITRQDMADNMRRDAGTSDYMNSEFTDWFQSS